MPRASRAASVTNVSQDQPGTTHPSSRRQPSPPPGQRWRDSSFRIVSTAAPAPPRGSTNTTSYPCSSSQARMAEVSSCDRDQYGSPQLLFHRRATAVVWGRVVGFAGRGRWENLHRLNSCWRPVSSSFFAVAEARRGRRTQGTRYPSTCWATWRLAGLECDPNWSWGRL